MGSHDSDCILRAGRLVRTNARQAFLITRIFQLSIIISAISLNTGCSKAENESSPKDSANTITLATSTNSKVQSTDKSKVDAPENQVSKKTTVPPSWQEQFVQKHAGGTQSGPLYDKYWTDVEKVADGVLKSGGNSGSVSKEQLAREIENGAFKGEQAMVAGALYNTFDQIKTPSRLNRMLFTTKINASDISKSIGKVKDGEKQFHEIDDLSYWATSKNNLQRFSGDDSGSVTYQDLTKALARHDINNEDRSNLQALESKFHAIAPDGKLGKSDLDSYSKNFQETNQNFILGKQFLHDMRHINDSQNDPNGRKLYADDNPLDSIKVDNVTQGFSGDCAFKAALGAVVVTDPTSVPGMLKEKSATDLQVNFPGMDGKSLHVKPPSDEEIGLYSWQANRGSWASALEKAYGEKVFQEAGATKPQLQELVDADRAAANGKSEDALQTLTGHQIDIFDMGQLSSSQIRSKIETAQSEKKALVVNSPAGNQSKETQDGFAIDHSFTVLGINARGDITVRDPRALGLNRPDGVMQISADKFKANFKLLFVETDRQA